MPTEYDTIHRALVRQTQTQHRGFLRMRKATLTVTLVAETDELLRRQIDEVEQVDSAIVDRDGILYEDASLDDEDEHFPGAPIRRAMDALRRIAQPLLNEIAVEVRDGPHHAVANGYTSETEDDLKDHLADLYYTRMRDALEAEFPDNNDNEMNLVWEAVVDWAFGPHALADVWFDRTDCDEIREAYLAVWGGSSPPLHEENIRKFCFDGPLEARIPRLAAMADDAYGWLLDCSKAECWLPAPDKPTVGTT